MSRSFFMGRTQKGRKDGVLWRMRVCGCCILAQVPLVLFDGREQNGKMLSRMMRKKPCVAGLFALNHRVIM